MNKQRILQSLLSVVLLIGSGLSLKLSVASIIALKPHMAIVALERTANADNSKELEILFNRMQTAIALFPTNANFYTLAGRYHTLLIQQEYSEYGPAVTAQFFATAVELEPTVFQHKVWQIYYLYQQYGWTNDIDIKLQGALKVAKYEKLLQQKLLPITIANWANISKSNQQNTHKMLDNMFSTSIRYFRYALRIADKYCGLNLLVAHAVNAQQTNEIEAKQIKQRNCS